jgi:hypothetical protein
MYLQPGPPIAASKSPRIASIERIDCPQKPSSHMAASSHSHSPAADASRGRSARVTVVAPLQLVERRSMQASAWKPLSLSTEATANCYVPDSQDELGIVEPV